MTFSRFINHPATKIIVLVIAILYSLSFTLWTITEDIYYWIGTTPFWQEHFMQIGMLFIFRFWTSIVGTNILTYTIPAFILGLLAFAIPYFSLQTKEERIANLHYLSLGIICHGYFGVTASPTTILLVIIGCIAIKCKQLTFKQCCWLSILTGLLILVRFPNLVIIPFVIIFIAYKENKFTHKIYYSLAYCAITICIYFILLSILTQQIHVLDYFQTTLTTDLSHVDDNHSSIKRLLWTYFNSAQNSLYNYALIIGGIICLRNCIKSSSTILEHILNIFMCIAIIFMISPFYINYSFRCFLYSYIQIAISIIILVYCCSIEVKRGPFIFALLLGLVSAAGSDTGLYRFGLYVPLFIPIILPKILNLYKNNTRKIYVIGTATFLMIFASYRPFLHLHKYEKFSSYNYNHQFMSNDEYSRLQNRVNLFKQYGCMNNTMFYGNECSHQVSVTVNSQQPYKVPFWQKADDKYQISRVCDWMNKDPQGVVMDYTKSSLMKEKLLAQGCVIVSDTEYGTIYQHAKE